MQIGVRITANNDPSNYFDMVLTYRWWVPGNDPWKVNLNGYHKMSAMQGEWFKVHSYGPERTVICLEGYYPGARNVAGEEKQILADIQRLPCASVGDLKVGDEGPSFFCVSGPSWHDNYGTWKVTWIG